MRLLVVDDDVQFTRDVAALLSRQNYVVDTAADGQTAWVYIQSYNYDLIVLDIMLPGLDGRNLCRRIRQAGIVSPILLLTARDSISDKVEGLDAGADDYVVKPFDWKELLARIRALLRREGAVTPSVLVWGNLQLNPMTCEVRYGEELVPLRRQEYRLLELFLRNPTRVLSCRSILEQLWTFDDNPPLEETVRAHIKSLRRQLKTVGAREVIETIYGLGYRLKSLEPEQLPEPAERLKDVTEAEQFKQLWQNLFIVWEEIKPEIMQQVAALEQLAEALQARETAPLLKEQAIANVHRLIGTVGSYGFARGSELARQIEVLLLESDCRLTHSQFAILRSHLTVLKQELAGEPQPSIPLVLSTPESSVRAITTCTRQESPPPDIEVETSDLASQNLPLRSDLPPRWHPLIAFDQLTQVRQRAKFTHDFRRLLQEAEQETIPVCLCIVSLSNLKQFNQTTSYQQGDRVLQLVAGVLRQSSCIRDLPGRWSGSKFAIALANHNKTQAEQYLAEVLQCLKPQEPLLEIQVAIAEFPQAGRDVEALYRAVEQTQ
ncbi:MAG: response regulator [Oscillatoriales cyanobacterium C42_A2020_001]|nr:response regulator [Leptolyngbyaceae cyanobacterium C42_A2020_001]